MFCSVCKDEYDKCLHIRGKEYKNIAYYFYIEDRKEQSESDVADLITIKEDESNPYNYKNKIYYGFTMWYCRTAECWKVYLV